MSSESSPKDPELEPKSMIRWKGVLLDFYPRSALQLAPGWSFEALPTGVGRREGMNALCLFSLGFFLQDSQQPLKEQPAGSSFHPVLPRDFRNQAQIISLYPSTEYQRSRIILGRFSLALEKNWRLWKITCHNFFS